MKAIRTGIFEKFSLRRVVIAAIIAAAFTVLAASGVLNKANNSISDHFYQRPSATDGEIVVIGIDRYALDVLGPMPWPRSVMAEVIDTLNADPDSAPAVIGVDVLYVGESGDPEADDALVEAARRGGNVVTAAAATFGSALVTEGDAFYMDVQAVLGWDAPFDALADVTESGHINAMADSDGILRHALSYVDVPGEGQKPSFARVVYQKYCEAKDIPDTAVPQVNEKGFFFLPYTAGPGGYYDGVSVVDVLDGNVDPEYYAGKIVLIGPYAAGMQDEYSTAVDHASHMYGIEIQANQVDALRKGFLPREVPERYQLALLFVAALLLIVLKGRKLSWLLIGWVGISVGWITFCQIVYRMGWVLDGGWIPMTMFALFIWAVADNYFQASQEKQRIKATFGRYVDPAILEKLLEQGGAAEDLGGKMFDIAVLFVDIRGFTTMSEVLDPATVVEILNRYLTLTTECIMRYHGTLDKFVGDCTMAFWNAPLPQKDAVYLACRAAMDMVEGSKALTEELEQRYGRTVAFGVGVHVGPAIVGNIGAPQRMDYTAIGDTVNTASRLESNAPGGTVYISRAVADALGDRARTTSLGSTIKLKGKAEGFECLTLDELDSQGGAI